jgi:hypothetical protein
MPGEPHTAMDNEPQWRTDTHRLASSKAGQAEMRGTNEKGCTLQSASHSGQQAVPSSWRLLDWT